MIKVGALLHDIIDNTSGNYLVKIIFKPGDSLTDVIFRKSLWVSSTDF